MRILPLFLFGFLLGGATLIGQDKGKLSYTVYSDYYYHLQRDSAQADAVLTGNEGFQAFQFRRIYVTHDYALSESFQSRIRLEADEAALTSDGKIGVFIKDAFLTWKKIFGSSNLTFGIQPTPAFEASEAAWGFRSLEKTIMDLRGMVGSRDFGISLRGTADPAGMIGYWALVANGTGSKPESDKLKRYYAHVSVRPTDRLEFTVYGDYSDRPNVQNPFTLKTVSNSVLTAAVFAGVTPVEEIRLGVEGVYQTTDNGFNTGTRLVSREKMAVSAFGRWKVSPEVELLGRYDYYDPNLHGSSTGDVRGYVLTGVSWSPEKGVRIIPNFQMETFAQRGSVSPKSSMTARITLEWSAP